MILNITIRLVLVYVRNVCLSVCLLGCLFVWMLQLDGRQLHRDQIKDLIDWQMFTEYESESHKN